MIQLDTRGSLLLMRLEHGKVSALDTELLTALAASLDEIESSDHRAVVLTGTGSTFSAGVDLWRVLNGGEPYLREFLPALNGSLAKLFAFPRPVIAAVNGHAIAGGCVLACACDHRIMADGNGRIGMPELRAGVPFPSVPVEILRFAASEATAQNLVYLGETYLPLEALQRGLVDEIVPPESLLDRACEVAEQLAAIPPLTFSITKRQLRQPVLDRAAQHGEALEDEVLHAWLDPEIHAVIRSFMQAATRKGSTT